MPRPTAPRARLEALHAAALALWLGARACAGATAAIIFPAMRELNPSLPAYGAYTGEHWKLAAGFAQARVFAVTDIVQFVAGMVAVGSLLALVIRCRAAIWPQDGDTGASAGAATRAGLSRALTAVRAVALVVAIACFGYYLVGLTPGMTSDLRAYWSAAMAGDNERALALRAAFEARHPTASALLQATLGAVLVALVAGIASAFRGRHAVAGAPPEPAR